MKKKLGIFITLGIVLVLAIVVLVLFLVPVNYMPNLKNPDQIRIYDGADQKALFEQDADKETYNDLLNKYNQAFSQSLLSAVFTGQTATAVKGNGKLDTVTNKTFEGLQFVLHYNEGQDLIVYGCKQSVSITDVYVQLSSDKSGYTKTDVYFKQINTDKTYYKFTTFVNQTNLYNTVNDLIK